MNLHPCLISVSLVIQSKGGTAIGSASGFFYDRAGRLFLVTNNHVCRDDSKGTIPDTLILKLHTDQNDLKKNADHHVPLYAGARRLWKNPPSNPAADVALVELDAVEIKKKFVITNWTATDFLPARYPLYPGEDVFVMGYPHGFHDAIHNLPVFRDAMIASAYRVPFSGLPLFVTDANLHPGTSGSPVLTKPKNVWVDSQGNSEICTGTRYYLVGVHSGTYSVLNIPLGLGAAWYAELVEETAAAF